MKFTLSAAQIIARANKLISEIDTDRQKLAEAEARARLSQRSFWQWIRRRPVPSPTAEAVAALQATIKPNAYTEQRQRLCMVRRLLLEGSDPHMSSRLIECDLADLQTLGYHCLPNDL